MKKRIAILIMAGLIITPVFCSSYILRFSHSGAFSDNDAQHLSARFFKTWLERESEGRINVRIFSPLQMGSPRDMLDGLSIDSLEAVSVPLATLKKKIPETTYFDIPFLFENDREVENFIEGPVPRFISREIKERIPLLYPVAFSSLGWWHHLFYLEKKEELSLDYLKEAKIAVFDKRHNKLINELNLNPVYVHPDELYGSFIIKTVDGVYTDSLKVASLNADNLLGSVYWQRCQFSLSVYLLNNQWLKKLPDDLRILVLEGMESAARMQTQVERLQQEQAAEEFINKGMKITVGDKNDRKAGIVIRNREREQFNARYGGLWDTEFFSWKNSDH